MSLVWTGAWLLIALTFGTATTSAAERLDAHGVDLSQTSVSGVSSGAYMAVQFHVAHSSLVKGIGVLAGGPYYCAQGSLWRASYSCMTPRPWARLADPAMLARITDSLAGAGRIDGTANLAGARVWLFTGREDGTVSPAVVDALRRYYARYVGAAAIVYVDGIEAGHGMVTTDFGVACSRTEPPFINDCDYDAAGALLGHIYGSGIPSGSGREGRLVAFDQREFAGGHPSSLGLADSGFAYVPAACAVRRCRAHIAFHGCRQNVEFVGEAFVANAGYNRWAEAHRLVVLYPQTTVRHGWSLTAPRTFVFNPRGCWDWWGYTGADYHTRTAPQIKAMKAMLDRVGEPRR